MKKIAFTSFAFLLLFLGASVPSGSASRDTVPVMQVKPTKDLSEKERSEQELDMSRVNNKVTLKYIAYKVRAKNQEKLFVKSKAKDE